jgi:bacterial/archaeal transporter family-2 protein
MILFLIVLTILIGTLLPVQASLNAELTRFLKHPLMGAFWSFLSGTLVLAVIILIQGLPKLEWRKFFDLPWYYYLGGAMGTLFVGSSIYLIPRLGATTMMAAFVTGQLIMSVIMDHYGILGLSPYPATTQRIIGVVLLFSGLLLVIKKSA